MKILILKPSSLGDVIQALPVLRLIKRHLPGSQVYWWIETGLAPLLEGDPDLAGLVHFKRRRWASPIHWPELVASVRWMREQRFDWVIDLQCLARSSAVAWFANGGLTVGLDEPREGARACYDLIATRPSFHTHAVDWYLRVLELVRVPVHRNFEWLPKRAAAAAAVEQRWPSDGTRWVVLQPGARWLNKRWPAEHFSQTVQQLRSAPRGVRFALLGGKDERDLGQAIASQTPDRCLDLTGQLSLPEMIEWIRRSRLMVTNDTGPMHVAAAVGTPVVALFGPTEPRRTGPYGQLQNVLQTRDLECVPCLRNRCRHPRPLECLTQISADQVAAAIRRHL